MTTFYIAGGAAATQFEIENASHVYTYAGPNGAIDSDTMTYNGQSWKKTYTYTGNNLTGESGWVKQ